MSFKEEGRCIKLIKHNYWTGTIDYRAHHIMWILGRGKNSVTQKFQTYNNSLVNATFDSGKKIVLIEFCVIKQVKYNQFFFQPIRGPFI